MQIQLSAGARAHAIAAVRRFFETERDETVGDLHAGFLVDAVLAATGPSVYNQGVRDAQAYVSAVVADLDVTLCEPEDAPTHTR